MDASAAPSIELRRPRSGFWAAAFAFLIVMAVATLPSPLYGFYRIRDNLSALTITVVFAIFAADTIAMLRSDNSVVARIGRRGVMLAALATMMVAMAVLAAWKDLPGLLIGRPLIAGCLAQWVAQPLTVPYLVFIALGAVALVGLRAAPETGAPVSRAAIKRPASAAGPESQLSGSRPRVRLPVPAAAATLAGFAANGLFAGLSGLFLGTTLRHPSHALSGAALFVLFSCGVASQLATARLPASRVLGLGTVSMLAGLVLLVVSVRLAAPSLALFLIGGALIGAGSGAVFKGTTGIVFAASPPESRVAMTSALLIALYVGLAVPVIGAGVALSLGATAPDTVLGFAIVVGLGVVASGWMLLGRHRPRADST